ncbi:MAG: DUF4192 domain-containing protein [Marmoricola sp.]
MTHSSSAGSGSSPRGSAAPYVARGPVDLIALAPQVIGFHPEDSVVLMTFGRAGTGGGRGFHARVDLPVEPDLQDQVTDLLVGAVRRNGAERAAVLLYSTDRVVALRQGRLLLDRLLEEGVEVIDVLRVERHRYFFPLEDDRTGTTYDVGTHPFTARSVFEGRVVQDSRAALAETLVGGQEDDRHEILAAAEAWADRMLQRGAGPSGPSRAGRAEARWIQGRLRRFEREGLPLGAVEAGQLLGSVAVISLRDVAWAEITRATAPRHVELWRDLLRRAPEELSPAPAALLAFSAWLAGDGALAWCAVDRCVAVDPDYSMAECVAGVLMSATPPSAWTGIPASDLPLLAADPEPPRRAG